MEKQTFKLWVQLSVMILIVGTALIYESYPLLLAIGVSFVLMAARKRDDRKVKYFTWATAVMGLCAFVGFILFSLIVDESPWIGRIPSVKGEGDSINIGLPFPWEVAIKGPLMPIGYLLLSILYGFSV